MISSSKLQNPLKRETRIVDISGANYDDIPEDFVRNSCKSCVYWEQGNGMACRSMTNRSASKRNWFNSYNQLYGSCGKLVYHNGKVVAYAQYAPASSFPMTRMYHTYPSEDAFLITCLVVARGFRRQGFGGMLLRSIVQELRQRGVRAIETFARKDAEDNPSGPTQLYHRFGFVTRSDNARLPLLRLELQEASLKSRLNTFLMIASDNTRLPMLRP